MIAKAAPHVPATDDGTARRALERAPDAWPVYVAIALSGMTALGAEVIWTRLLSLLFGATVYTFSLILAVFLFGLGIGSSIGSADRAHASRGRALALGWCQMLLCARDRLDGVHAHAVAAVLADQSVDFDRPVVQLPARSRPLPLGGPARRDSVGRELSAGARVGRHARQDPGAAGRRRLRREHGRRDRRARVTASLLLVVWLGSQHAQQVLVLVSAISALLMFESAAVGSVEEASHASSSPARCCSSSAMGERRACWRGRSMPVPGILVAYGRYAATRLGGAEIIYVGEGWNASVAVSRLSNGVLNYHNAGKVQASSEPQDMRLQRMLGHMTTLIPRKPGVGARHRLRRRRDGRRGLGRSERQALDDRRDRAAGARGSSRNISATTTSTSSTTRRRTSCSTTRGTSC